MSGESIKPLWRESGCRYLGPRWAEQPGDTVVWARSEQIPGEELWRTHERRRERLVGNGAPGGLIDKDLDSWLAKAQGSLTVQSLTNLVLMMPQGSRVMFDKQTHRRVVQRTTRLTYIYLAARLLGDREPSEIADDALEHLEKAHSAIRLAWGSGAWPRFASAHWENLDASLQDRLVELLGESKCEQLCAQSIAEPG